MPDPKKLSPNGHHPELFQDEEGNWWESIEDDTEGYSTMEAITFYVVSVLVTVAGSLYVWGMVRGFKWLVRSMFK